MEGAAAPLLRLEGITRRFPGVVANDDVSLDLHGGEVHALLGENGAGKSTLIAILSGVLRPDAGRILIEGREVAMAFPRDAIARGIGTVPQHPSPVPTLTVVENLMLGEPWWRTLPRGAARARLREIGAAFGVALDPDVAAGALSPVQAQQLGLVRALWHAPRVLVLDEPAAVPGAADLARMLDRLRAAGLAVLLVTHRLPDVLACADRVTVLRQGRVSGGIAPADRRALPEGEVATRILGMMFGPQPDTATPSRRAPPGGLAPVLEVEDLSTRPDGARPGLDRVSLTLRPGEVLGIAGLEGQGQRALAEALAGQVVPEAGRIRLGGGDVTALGVAARAALGLRHVTDDRLGEGIVAPFSLALNLLLKRVGAPPFWRGGVQDETAIRRHAEALIARHDIRAPGPATPAGRLSGGNIQKAILARELDEGARVVVLNRPTHGLDHAATQATHRRIREAAEAGVGLLLISAEIEELLLLCDRVIVLSRGRAAGEVANAPGAGARIGALIAA